MKKTKRFISLLLVVQMMLMCTFIPGVAANEITALHMETEPLTTICEFYIGETHYKKTESVSTDGKRIVVLECEEGTIVSTYNTNYTVIEFDSYSFSISHADSVGYLELQPRFPTRCIGNPAYGMGFSGTEYSYSFSQSNIVLNSGGFSKTGAENIYSNQFVSCVGIMNDIYSSLSDQQRIAWMAINIAAMLPSPPNDMPPFEVAQAIIYSALEASGVDLGPDLSATALALTGWYEVEQDAISAFDSFN